MSQRGRWAPLAFALVLSGTACGGGAPPAPASADTRSGPVSFSYYTLDGTMLSSDTTRGRATVIVFVTTFDLASQVVARHVNDLTRAHRPRINAVAIVVEPPKHAPLAQAFVMSMDLRYPVCMADHAIRRGRGPFGEISGVPTILVLDAKSRVVWRRDGGASREEMEEALAKATGRGNAPPD